MGKLSTNMRLNTDLLITNTIFLCIKTNHYTIHPIADGAVCIMVKGVHGNGLEIAVGADTIPTFPNGSSAFCYRIQPRWIGFLQQQSVRHIAVTITTQHMTQIGGAQKSGG